MKDTKSIIFVPDVHWPDTDTKALNILLDIIKDVNPDYFIFGGDQLSMNSLSFWENGKPKKISSENLLRDYKTFNDAVLQPIEKRLSSKCKRVWITGNHEFWVQRYIDTYPTLEGLLEVDTNLPLDNWEIIPYNDYFKLYSSVFIHGNYITKYHASKTLSVYNCDVYYGHTHQHQVHMAQSPIDSYPKKAVSVGTLATRNPSYNNNKPNNHILQFMVIDIIGRRFYDNPVFIKGGETMFRGKRYSG